MKTMIIAEAGVNHNGSREMAFQLVDAAHEARADLVKFQTFIPEKVMSRIAKKAEYQAENTGDGAESQLDMVRKLKLEFQDFRDLQKYCDQKGIPFFSTAFDLESFRFLCEDLRLQTVKIPSGEITNARFLYEVGRTGLPVLLSTGMATIGEIEAALGVLAYAYTGGKEPGARNFSEAYLTEKGRDILKQKVSLLQCTTNYPAPAAETNLRVIPTLRSAFDLRVGYSDHTLGTHIACAAVAMGATIVEKHFTLDTNLPGPDHKASLAPHELKALVAQIREIESAMGSSQKFPSRTEISNREIARRSLVAASPIRKGETFTQKNVDVKRPGSGISPFRYWELLGQAAPRDFNEDELIEI